MLVAVIQASDHTNSKEQIQLASQHADCIELRLDYATTLNIDSIASLQNETPLPVIFTLRKKSQGGHYSKDEDQRLKDILKLCRLNPNYLDLEYDTPKDVIKKIHHEFPQIKLICSYHDFSETPERLDKLLENLLNPDFHTYKIATHAASTVDALRMITFIKSASKHYQVTGICMGPHGTSTRILGPIMGNLFTYASINAAASTAPGQLTLHELINQYHFHQLNSESKIYALIGDPIEKSVGNILHNIAIRQLQQKAVYIKLSVTTHTLSRVIELCRKLNFGGLSVTMPLKEMLAPYLDKIDISAQAMKSINTITIDAEQWSGLNTDGEGAMRALANKIHCPPQTIIILGAGGSAKAIAYAAIQQGYKVILINRTFNKVKQLAQELDCEGYGLDKLNHLKETKYSIIINTLPLSNEEMRSLLKPTDLLPGTIALDIIYQPIKTEFLEIAESAGCICIPGFKMYIQQALLQIQSWFNPNKTHLSTIKEMMENYFQNPAA
jgi:3-dehydroquinate dehydratase/shikimate dehydrogenase